MPSTRGFDSAKYLGISQDHLVAAALWLLVRDKRQPSFENLVAEAFRSFPKRFQLEGYPEWPNAHVVGKAWVRCRTDKKWMSGSASEGFKLTPLGEQIAERVISELEGQTLKHSLRDRKGSRQSISARVVLRIENSPAYLKYKSSSVDSISEYEFCELLYCTLESTSDTVKKNFSVVRQQVESYGRADLLQFLDKLQEKFPGKFIGTRPRGGLMPKKKEIIP